MSNTVKQLGFIPTNRGEFDTTGQTKYYKDNVVQYRNGSYICSPVGYSTSNPTAYTTDAPYQDGDTELNANWKLMASIGLVDSEPTAGSENLVKSGGAYNEISKTKEFLSNEQICSQEILTNSDIDVTTSTIISNSEFNVYYYKVNKDDYVELKASLGYPGRTGRFTVLLTESIPEVGVQGVILYSESIKVLEKTFKIPADGFICIYHYPTWFTDLKCTLFQYGKYNIYRKTETIYTTNAAISGTGKLMASRYSSFCLNRAYSKNFLRVDGCCNSEIIIRQNSNQKFQLFLFDANRDNGVWSEEKWYIDTENIVPIPKWCKYIKVYTAKNDNSNIVGYLPVDIEYNVIVGDSLYAFNKSNIMEESTPGVIQIDAPIIISNPNSTDAETSNVQDNNNTLLHNYGLLLLPENYNEDGEPIKMIIFCHGAAQHYNPSSTEIYPLNFNQDYVLKEGYAILDMDGNLLNNSAPSCNAPMAVESYIAGYKWVIERFNIDERVYIAGMSQGGGMATILSNYIPCRAICAFAPVTNVINQFCLNPSYRSYIASYFGLVGTEPNWGSSQTLTQEELDYLYSEENIRKMKKYSLSWLFSNLTEDEISNSRSNFVASPTQNDITLYQDKIKINAIPLKIFQGSLDNMVIKNWTDLVVKMMQNMGSNIEYRIFSEAGHGDIMHIGNNTVITALNKTVTNVPTSHVEMIKYFKRY